MTSLLFFIPLALYILVILFGLFCAVLSALILKRSRASRRSRLPLLPQPPLLPDAPQHRPASTAFGILCLKVLLPFSVGLIVLGLLGAASTRLSISYVRKPALQWTDGRAPALEPLIRKHALPFLAQGQTVGLAVAVVTPTNATLMTFGRPALSSRTPTRPDKFFEIGSITKTFTALILARDIERGSLRLDQSIHELLPPHVSLPEPARGITLRHLTTHTAGLPRVPANMSPRSALEAFFFGADPYARFNEPDLLAAMRSVTLQSAPGTKSSYSNFGMTLLGYLLARQAGTNYCALLRREVCLPLGMSDTTVATEPAQAPRIAQGYRVVVHCGPFIVALRSAPWFIGNELGGAGAIRSTPADMLKYLQANMHPEGQRLEHAL
jgi:CubicO group peptidase (beta-lactamase class C family)